MNQQQTDAHADFESLSRAAAPVPGEPYCYVCFGPGDKLVAGRPGSATAIYDCAECRKAGRSA